jgi:hypothetical protein
MDELSVTEADDVSRLLDNEESETVEGAQEDADIPKDKFHLVYFSMVIFGAGFLFPFNSFVAAADYFLYIYPGYYAEVVFSFMYMYVTLFSILFTVMTTEVLPLSGRLGFGYVCMFVGLLAIPLLDVGIHNCTLPVGSAFGVTIVCITLISIGAGVQQSSFYGLAGMLSKRHVQAIMVGESECMSSLSVWEYFHVCIASKHFSLVLFVFINHFSSLCTKDSLCTGCNREQLFMYSH